MSQPFRLIMISAMYENGGNTTQRFLDGHPQLFSYPFESQPGTKFCLDHLTSMYPVKYRWPIFSMSNTLEGDYESIIDEECKVRLKTPQASKFRDYPIEMNDKERKQIFVQLMEEKPRTRANLIEAFYRASATAWKDYQRSGEEVIHVGYSPIIGVDADKIASDSENFHVLNIIRNPWSAYADTKKRAVPLSLSHYITGWCLHQQAALTFSKLYPQQVHYLRFEDIIVDPVEVLGKYLNKFDLRTTPSLAKPTWNSKVLDQVYPWGTVRTPTTEANVATANELSTAEKDEIRLRTEPLLNVLGYHNFSF
jgi:hypothetical protein